MKATPPQVLVGGKPFWNNGNLFYVDMFGKALYRYSFAEDKAYKTVIAGNDKMTGIFLPIKNNPNQYIVGMGNTVGTISWDGHSASATKVRELFHVAPTSTLNGLFVSPKNDFYTGDYDSARFCGAPQRQSVFGYLRNKQLKTFATDTESSAGMVLIEATNTVYHIDACLQVIKSFKWNPSNGELCTRKLFSYPRIDHFSKNSSVFSLSLFSKRANCIQIGFPI